MNHPHSMRCHHLIAAQRRESLQHQQSTENPTRTLTKPSVGRQGAQLVGAALPLNSRSLPTPREGPETQQRLATCAHAVPGAPLRLLDYASTSRGTAVAAFPSEAVATQSGHETAAFVFPATVSRRVSAVLLPDSFAEVAGAVAGSATAGEQLGGGEDARWVAAKGAPAARWAKLILPGSPEPIEWRAS